MATTDTRPALVWFREDLRLSDNQALSAAADSGAPVAALFVLEERPGLRPRGAAARWWLAESLKALAADLSARGVRLILKAGDPTQIVPEIARRTGAGLVVWNRRYDPGGRAADGAIKEHLSASGLVARSFPGRLIREPWTVASRTGDPMKVFTPFWRAHGGLPQDEAPLPPPRAINAFADVEPGDRLEDWRLQPTAPDWAAGFRKIWRPGEAGAKAALAAFLDAGVETYADDRNRPDLASTSRLSPHLAFGEMTPRQIWRAAEAAAHARQSASGLGKFFSELGWREFAYHLLYHWPDLASENFQKRFDAFPWTRDDAGFRAWAKGMTGYPIVDAGMRELWTTGWMHNRVRMIAASFLIKHLMTDWRRGEAWFWDTLLDADPANNAASWQWVAGSGADAAPYFRIFNPILQGQKFDPGGDYVRRFVPELANLPNAHIHSPFDAPPDVLARAGVRLGATYPAPIVDHGAARDRALAAFSSIKPAGSA